MAGTTVVDSQNLLASHFGFKIVPNGIFVDEEGRIRLLKQGLQIGNPDHVAAVEKLITGEAEQLELEDSYHKTESGTRALEKQLAATKFKLALEYLNQGKTADALQELDEALLLDTDNFLIRKQRWYIRHPEKFAPVIDIDWQQEQYEKEKREEAQRLGLECGPAGCLLPGYTPKPKV